MQTLTEQEERRLKRKLQALHLSADDRLLSELGERAGVAYAVDAQGMNDSTAESVGKMMNEAENLVREVLYLLLVAHQNESWSCRLAFMLSRQHQSLKRLFAQGDGTPNPYLLKILFV
jgi:hypothetical protein